MPTVLRIGAYRFFFYAGDGSEPPHVHVEREDKTAKFWLNPVRLEESYGFQPHELNRIQYLIEEYRRNLLQRWEDFFFMNDFSNAFAQQVTITDDALVLDLADGRTISAPLAWYPRLFYGTAEERSHWRFIGHGEGISWTDLDEDISVANVLQGKPSRESPRSFARWIEQRKGVNVQRDQQPALEMEFAASIEKLRACGERG